MFDEKSESLENIKLEKSWKKALQGEFGKEYFRELTDFVRQEYLNSPKDIYPAPKDIFRAFELCPFDNTRVVIIGQDPYHGPKQANGLCFAVHDGIKLPPSLKNIFIEIENDLGPSVKPQRDASGNVSGDLSRWAKQGVLLLNATLTVRANTPGSHQGKGWEKFTDAAIQTLSDQCQGLVFILWGNYAKQKGSLIDRKKHLILEAAHPSPFSAYGGFFGCKHFSKVNEYLKKRGEKEIDWR